MAKSAHAGELRTRVYFYSITRTQNANGYSTETLTNVFGDDVAVRCKWVAVYGTEVFTAQQLKLREPVTVTMRWSPRINEQLLVCRVDDQTPYEIISMNNVEQKNRFLELKIQRKEAAR